MQSLFDSGVRAAAYMRRVVVLLLLLTATKVSGQQTAPHVTLRQAESEVWSRLAQRAQRLSALMLDSAEIDLRFPIQGEPEEVIGVTRLTDSSLVVATARLEPLESITSRQQPFHSGRYDLRIEDRAGNCLLVHQTVKVDTSLVRLQRSTEPCRSLYMAEVVRRSLRLARIPLNVGQLTDNWSVAPTTTAFIDVYADSVVVMTTKLMLQANLPGGDTSGVRIDSVTVGLALGDRSWNIVRKGRPTVVDTVLHRGELWSQARHRFTIPVDSTFALTQSWPVVEVSLSVPKTESNQYGLAWTYAHAPKDYFKNVPWPPE